MNEYQLQNHYRTPLCRQDKRRCDHMIQPVMSQLLMLFKSTMVVQLGPGTQVRQCLVHWLML